LQVAGILADLDARTIVVDRREVFLSTTEFNLLVHFMAHAGRVLSRERLLADLWSSQIVADNDRIIDVYVRRLRERIEADPSDPRRLVTRRGKGYTLLDVAS
jgi:two-component system response regulator VicR